MSLTNAKAGLEGIKNDIYSENTARDTYWFSNLPAVANKRGGSICFLPAFDEYMISYKDRSSSLDPSMGTTAVTGNGIFRPIIVVNGKVTGIWKRTIKKDTVLIETQFFKDIGKSKKQDIFKAAQQYGDFLSMKTLLV